MSPNSSAAVEAWATVVGVAAAATAAIFAALAWRAQMRTERKVRAGADAGRLAAERAQASLVSGWVDVSDRAGAEVVVRNASKTPVYALRYFLYVGLASRYLSEVHVVVPPGDLVQQIENAAMMVSVTPLDATLMILFTDAAGISWQRGQDGALTKVL